MKLITIMVCIACASPAISCAYGVMSPRPSTIDASDDTSNDASDAQDDVLIDSDVDAGPLCCVVPADSGCAQYIYGCVFTCGKASNGLTDIPWLAWNDGGTDVDCQQSHIGFHCHTVDGDGVVMSCN